jgi:hypothetical protein
MGDEFAAWYFDWPEIQMAKQVAIHYPRLQRPANRMTLPAMKHITIKQLGVGLGAVPVPFGAGGAFVPGF